MKSVLFIGVGMLIGGTAASLYILRKRKRKNDSIGRIIQYEEYSAIENSSLVKVDKAQEESMRDVEKDTAISRMAERHESAASVVQDSVERIRENLEVSEKENSEIEKASAELDKMLSED